MTDPDVERRLTVLLHRHAEEAMDRTDTLTALATFQQRADEDQRGRARRRAGAAAAGLVAAAAVAGGLWLAYGRDAAPVRVEPASPAPSSVRTSEPEPVESPQTPGSTVTGFEGDPAFPMTYEVPARFRDPSAENGTRGYSIAGTSGSAAALHVASVDGQDASRLPDDLAARIRQTREELVVSDVGTTRVAGMTAQTFTLAQRPGTSPYDLLCAEGGSCYKLLDDKPMDVTAVRTANGLVLFWVEYDARDRARVQGPMQAWLSSVRWE